MNVTVSFQNLRHSPWMDEYLERKLNKIGTFLHPSTRVNVNFRQSGQAIAATLAVHDYHRDWAFHGDGSNLVDALTQALEKAKRALREQRRKIKDKMHRRFQATDVVHS